jgi:hypothetical protein
MIEERLSAIAAALTVLTTGIHAMKLPVKLEKRKLSRH